MMVEIKSPASQLAIRQASRFQIRANSGTMKFVPVIKRNDTALGGMGGVPLKLQPIVVRPPIAQPPIAQPPIVRPPIVRPPIARPPIVIRPELITLGEVDFSKPSGYQPRDRLTVPVCMSATINDEILFEAAENENQKLYLPRYEIATHRVSGKQQFRILLEQNTEEAGGRLIVHLVQKPAAAVENLIQNAKIIEHQVDVSLTFFVPTANQGSLPKELFFQEITKEQDGVKVVLTVKSLIQLTQLYQALSDDDYHAELSIKRYVQSALPLYPPVTKSNTASKFPNPRLVITRREEFVESNKPWIRIHIAVTNRHVYHDNLFVPSPNLPPCGFNKSASRTFVDIMANSQRHYGFCALSNPESLADLWFVFPKGQAPGDSIHIVLNDRLKNHLYKSNSVSIVNSHAESSAPLFRKVSKEFEDTIQFTFPEQVFGYIYRDVTNDSSQKPGLISRKVPDSNNPEIFHIYLQDEANLETFYFLPDEFKLIRHSDILLFPPSLNIQWEAKEQNTEQLEATISYELASYFEPARIEAAADSLRQWVPDGNAANINFELMRLPSEQLRYRLFLLGRNILRESASVSLRKIKDVIPSVSLNDLGKIFADLLEKDKPTNNVFSGEIEVVNTPEFTAPRIPVTIKFGDTIGELFSYSYAVNQSNNKIEVTLTNEIESTVKLNTVKVQVLLANILLNTTTQGISEPITFASQDTIKFDIVFTSGEMNNLEKIELSIDLSDVDIQFGDGSQLYTAISNTHIRSKYNEDIKVHEKSVLGKSDNQTQIEAITIDFKYSESSPVIKSITLTNPDDKDTTQSVALPLPLRDFVLNLPTSRQYYYRITVITTQETTGEWIGPENGDLFITDEKIPEIPKESTELQQDSETSAG